MDSAQARRRRFEELAATTYEPVQRYLRRRTDPEAAQDVLAEVLLRLHRATATLREALRKDELSAGHLGQRQGREVEQ